MDTQRFAILFAETGLKPEDFDLAALQDAYERLRGLLGRLDAGAPEDEMLAVFDPGRPL